MPITLTAVTWADDWNGQIEDRRVVEWTLEFSTKIYMFGPVASTSIILDSRAIIAVPPKGKGVPEMSRVQDQEGTEVGFVNVPVDDSEAVYDNDRDLSPRIINLEDSDGNIIKIVRPVSNI